MENVEKHCMLQSYSILSSNICYCAMIYYHFIKYCMVQSHYGKLKQLGMVIIQMIINFI